jgi:Peptidase family M1 domain
MASQRWAVAGMTSLALLLLGVGAGVPALAGTAKPAGPAAGHRTGCSAGAHTLAPHGSHLYPDTGNGGYTSLHTDVHLAYDAASNRFLAGNHVTLTDQATQCLTSFSLDFERRSVNATAGPDLTIRSVRVNGHLASFRFVQPTYPGDPKGQDDPNPLAHEASQVNPVGGPHHNPLPPACSPELTSTNPAKKSSKNGTQCPANKLVITPQAPIGTGSTFRVTVAYTGRPGVHNDGDGTTEGWFRSNQPKGDGGFVTTEPVGTEDWMPLNDYPTAKPTYDFYDTVNAGKTVLANGMLESRQPHPASAQFPHGSVTWHWHSAAPVASYLVENSVGHFDLTQRMVGGIKFYQAQASSLSAARKAKNRAIMNKQPDITKFESKFTGPFPFTSDGVVVGRPSASFEEEMQTMITFAGGEIDTDTLYHENMHQWWGDHVTEGGYHMTFYKEGMATLAEFLFAARQAQGKAGGPGTAAGRRAFQRSLVGTFNFIYRTKDGFWTVAPSNPTPWGLFSGSSTYDRPGIAYIALRQILGPANFTHALVQVQQQYGGGSITEPQWEAAFHHWLPSHSAACQQRLSQFFTQWFDTAYPHGGGANRPHVTGPGLDGPGFYTGACTR